MSKTLRPLTPFLLLSLPGLLLGAFKGLTLGQAWFEKIDKLIPVWGVQYKAPSFFDALSTALSTGPTPLLLIGLLFLLLLIGWTLLLRTLGIRLGRHPFQKGRWLQNIAKVVFPLFVPIYLALYFLAMYGEDPNGVSGEGFFASSSTPKNLIFLGFWVLLGLWLRLGEKTPEGGNGGGESPLAPLFQSGEIQKSPLPSFAKGGLLHGLFSLFAKKGVVAVLLSILGAGGGLLILTGFDILNANLYPILTVHGWQLPSPKGVAALCFAYAVLFYFLFLTQTLLLALLFRPVKKEGREKATIALGLSGVVAVAVILGGGVYLNAVSRGYGRNFLRPLDIPWAVTIHGNQLLEMTLQDDLKAPGEDDLWPFVGSRLVLFSPSSGPGGVPGVMTDSWRGRDTSLITGSRGKRLTVSFPFGSAFPPHGRSLDMNVTPGNQERLVQFAEWGTLGYPSRAFLFGKAGVGYFMLWEPEKGFELLHRAMLESGFHPALMGLEVTKLSYGLVNEQSRSRLLKISVERSHTINPGILPRLAKAWAHFGDLRLAKHFKEKALKSDGWVREKAEGVIIPESPPLQKGEISGSVKISGRPLAHGKIGIFEAYLVDVSPGIFVGNGLVDVRRLGLDGGFAFQELGEGDYVLALLTSDSLLPVGAVTIKGSPGVIRLDVEHPKVVLPPIEIDYANFDEAKVRSYLLEISLVKSGMESLSADQRMRYNAEQCELGRSDVNALEALRRAREGVYVLNPEDFEKRQLGWAVTRKGSDREITGREVRLSTDK